MKITNRSNTPTQRLRPLVSFAERFFKKSFMARLLVQDALRPGTITGGQAERDASSGAEPDIVRLWLGREVSYPAGQTHVPEVGQVVFYSWDEEFLFVLCHELKHIDDFRLEPDIEGHELEVRAESYALGVLEVYRSELRIAA